jgi:DNA processing protein
MMCSTANLENWLALYHSPGIGDVGFHRWIAKDPSISTLPDKAQPDWLAVKRDLTWAQQGSNHHILTLQNSYYPIALKNTVNPPPVLYVLGDISCLSRPQLAIVGSRQPSPIGAETAFSFAKQLTAVGLQITSGLAVGIDGASHRGALSEPNAKTIAVLANGVDTVYPQRHKDLAAQIVAHGCLLSEFPIGTAALPGYFPRRNRIISGLSLGVLVVEATLHSGSLITARYAIEQGRDVFAIPGPIDSPKVKGCHHLIRQGAKLVETPQDVIEELAVLLNCGIRDKSFCGGRVPQSQVALSSQQQQLLDFIDYDSTCVDAMVARTGFATNIVAAVLLELELQGLITAVPGGYARKLS